MPLTGAITGWGTALPPTVVTNADLEARLDTTDEWILERSGISERHVGGTVSGLSTEAGAMAIERAGLEPKDIELLILATTTPDMAVPATSAAVHHALGLSGGAFDLNAACAGFIYALFAAQGSIATGIRRVLVIGADCLSQITDHDDRSTAVLFADGAGAILLEANAGLPVGAGVGSRTGTGLGIARGTGNENDGGAPESSDVSGSIAFDLGTDGSALDLLFCPHGGTMKMEGKEVFRRAVRTTVASASAAMQRAKISPEEVALFVPHQANLRIIEAAAQRLGIPMDRTAVVLDRTGNTSSASIPLALATSADEGRLSAGDHVLMCGFGAGMSWASAVVPWVGDAAR